MKEHIEEERKEAMRRAEKFLEDVPLENVFPKNDSVNSPAHYAGDVECIDVMVQQFGFEMVRDFAIVNAFKYLFRCTHKHETPDEDIKKAIWWLRFAVDDDPRKDS